MTNTHASVAVVDDEDAVRRALARLLRAAGFLVESFSSGRQFLDSLQDRRPDCVILDLHMPDGDGFAVLEHLAPKSPRLPVVVLTGRDTPESRERVQQLGVVGYLRKPVEGTVLVRAIEFAIAPAGQGDGT